MFLFCVHNKFWIVGYEICNMKKIIVYGAGISGLGVAEVLKKHGEEVIIYTDEWAALKI